MRQRRTIRSFQDKLPPRELVEELLELASSAPSASNNQPWRFFVSDRSQVIAAMAEAVRQAVSQLPDDPQIHAYGDYFVRFERAPVVVVAAFRPLALLSQMAPPTPVIERLELYSSLASTSLAVQNLLLAAHQRGLGASCMSGPLLAAPAIESLLGIAPPWQMGLLVALGYPAEQPAPPRRKSLSTILRWVESPGSPPPQPEGGSP